MEDSKQMQPIAKKLHSELKRTLLSTGILIAAALGTFTLASVQIGSQNAKQLLLEHAQGLAVAASNSGDLLSLEKNLNRFVSDWKSTQRFDARIQVKFGERLAASAGPTDSFRGISTKGSRSLQLPSGERLEVTVQISELRYLIEALAAILILEIALLIVFITLNRRIKKSLHSLTRPLEETTAWLNQVAASLPHSSRSVLEIDSHGISEVGSLHSSISTLLKEITNYESTLVQVNLDKGRLEIADQVSHDIASPLSTLDMSISRLVGISKDDQSILQGVVSRIRDITNSLRREKRDFQKSSPTLLAHGTDKKTSVVSPLLLHPIMDRLVTQKRIQYQGIPSVEIQVVQTAQSYGLFAAIEQSEFQRILSNLIDNSVDAKVDKTKITISAKSLGNLIKICIVDDGTGIPIDILPRLGARGETFGKINGSGLGLFHAKKCIENWGGHFEIDSILGKGTQITLTLPRINTPDWFCSKVRLENRDFLVVVDDDPTIRQFWKNRIRSEISADSNSFALVTLGTPEELQTWIKSQSLKSYSACYLIDHDFGPDSINGLELIEQLGIESQSILVTSRYSDENISAWCNLLGIKRIPKDSIGFVPVHVSGEERETNGPAIGRMKQYEETVTPAQAGN